MTNRTLDIAVTGCAAISAAGVGAAALREAVDAGTPCLTPVPAELLGEPGHYWGKADAFRAADFMPPLKARKFDRSSLLATVTAGLALQDAGATPAALGATRIGIALGCGFGGIANSVEFLSGYFSAGIDGLVPMLFPNTVANAPASNASIEHGLKGPNVTQVQRFCSAETALQMACRFLAEGRADVMLAGGVDELNAPVMQGFHAMGQLRRYAHGFGEGCGILVLERRDHAERRGTAIRGTIDEIRTIGFIPEEHCAAGTDRLLGATAPELLSLSGTAPEWPPVANIFPAVRRLAVGPLVGRSLAMGGLAMVSLLLLLAPGQRGLHLAASPEGPYFGIDFTGGGPV
ncbi:beta-ketoacyl synthase [Geotalea uraniireducens]|uniref:Beta-ketoacyl synthase n=1 Tax=Geotalea uraniireducens TaxID=351604 RepID=A0ABN6VPQ7_9BACT|nr:beta-ketoacyl synthase N-terminal-like domain-containing protein [Geotalea uraniireducens]BDV41272.1 beta-ketoacyl synthase [Geotalea uraniireducens]